MLHCVRYDSHIQHRLQFSSWSVMFSATYEMNLKLVYVFIHSFRCLLYNKSVASSNAISPSSVILCFLFQFLACCLFLKVSSSCLHHLPIASLPTFILPPTTCFRRQFLCKMWPIHLAFFLSVVCRIFIFSLILCNTSSFSTRSVQLILSILHQHHISKLPGISDLFSEMSKC